MKRLIASSLAALVTAAALAPEPALGESQKKTELIALDGRHVDRMQLRHDFDAAWVIDNQNILYRDDSRDYYLVTLEKACEPLEMRGRSFHFFPTSWQLRTSRAYEVRPEAGTPCDVARIEQVDDARARPLRAASERRVW